MIANAEQSIMFTKWIHLWKKGKIMNVSEYVQYDGLGLARLVKDGKVNC